MAGEEDYTAGRRHTDGEARGADVHDMAALDIMTLDGCSEGRHPRS